MTGDNITNMGNNKSDNLQINDVLFSNNGYGPNVAQITGLFPTKIIMQRWGRKQKNKQYFELPRWFLSSPSCGWKHLPVEVRP